MTSYKDIPPCRRPGAPAHWWLEPDLDDSDVKGNKPAAAATAANSRMKSVRRDLFRGKLLCLRECPMLAECRSLGWDEPAHVWGGLDAKDRYNSRRRGCTTQKGGYFKSRGPNPTRERVISEFLRGSDTWVIAETLGQTENSVMYHIRVGLAEAGEQREEREPWSFSAPPPPLPRGMTSTAFRDGRECAYLWETATPESASC